MLGRRTSTGTTGRCTSIMRDRRQHQEDESMDNSGKETKRFGRRKIHERSKKRRQRRGQHDEKEGANEAQTKRRAPKHRQTTSKPNRQRESAIDQPKNTPSYKSKRRKEAAAITPISSNGHRWTSNTFPTREQLGSQTADPAKGGYYAKQKTKRTK